jgi:replicative DNA helicase
MDLSWLYDNDNIFDAKKKQKQEEWLDNTPIEQIADIIDKRISSIKIKYADGFDEQSSQAGENVLELLESLKETPEYGYPLFGPLINSITRGARLKKFYLRSAAAGVGKAIPNRTIIPTPNGYREVGSIKEGDYLFDRKGKPTKVLKVHPQKGKKEVWEVVFSDGRIAQCCKDHLWEYRYEVHRGYGTRVETTEEIYERTKSLKYGFFRADGKRYRYQVKLNGAVEYECGDRLDNAYAKGMLIADKNKKGWVLSIPIEYKLASIEDRKELLRGLLDIDGTIDKLGKVTFSANSYKLAKDVVELARSLGYKAASADKTKEAQTVVIHCKKEEKPNLFSVGRKKKRAEVYANDGKEDRFKEYVDIVGIRKTDEKVPMTCFTVDNEECLFLMNDFIVTHNTRAMIADACNFACDELFDYKEHKWVKNGTKEPTVFITTEQEISEIQTMMIAFISNVDEEHILTGRYTDEEWNRVVKAAEILNTSPLYIQELHDFSMQDIENTLKRSINEHGTKFLCLV